MQQNQNNIIKYHWSLRIAHWAMSLMILSIIVVGNYMADLPSDAPGKYDFYPLHKSFGLTVLCLALMRIMLKLMTKAPADTTKGFERVLSKAVQLALYAFMIMMPLSGYFMSIFGGYPVAIFGYALPSIFEANKEIGAFFYEAHGLLAYVFLGFLALHVLGWLKHLIVDKVNLIQRML